MKHLADDDFAKLESRIAARKAEAEELGGYGWWSDMGRGIRQRDGEGGFELLVPIIPNVVGFVIKADPKTVIAQCDADQALLKQLRQYGAEAELFDIIMASLWVRYQETAEEFMASRC